MLLDKDNIAKLIPHTGAMCLLDEILSWDEFRIRAATRTHLDERNPLRHDGHLPAVAAVEYAAQTMAVHGSLARVTTTRPRAGYLVSARDVVLHEPALDALDDALIIEAERVAGDVRGVLYRFDIRHRERTVANGILMVILDVGETPQ